MKEFTFRVTDTDFFSHKFSLMNIFFVIEEKLGQRQSPRRLRKEEIIKRLKDSLVYNENIDKEDLNEWANIVESYEEAIIIRIRSYNKRIRRYS